LEYVVQSARGLGGAAMSVGLATLMFAALAFLVKPGTWLADSKAAAGQTRINLIIAIIDQTAVAPVLGALVGWAGLQIRALGLQLDTPHAWDQIGRGGTLLLCIVASDFISYWRHRAQHTTWLWPAHAIHHSDTHVTWFSYVRLHPVDRLGAAMDTIILGVLGFPIWALAFNAVVRRWYGYLIHADLPFTWRGWILTSPVMHRWHHAREVAGSGSNFATVFSVFDRVFGTHYVPGRCDAPLGVCEDMGKGALGQYLHPFKVWAASARRRRGIEIVPGE
jgi:sterol desaturase/sphingolipid hydroxylase (fatty acid hydroxylase superfamily)